MVFQKNQKKINSILKTIYKPSLNEKDIDYLEDQILQIIKKFNQKNLKKKLNISEFSAAITDAIVEPLLNSVWYFILDKYWASKYPS